MYKLFVALRYLRRNWLNVVGVLAVAIGVVVLICVLSVMKGFDEEFRSRIRATLSDLIVESPSDGAFGGYEALMARIEKMAHVVAVAPEYEGLALIRLGEGRKLSRYAEFHGIDLPLENKATDLADYWRAWRGRAARDAFTGELGRGARLDAAPKEKIEALLSQTRREDFALLGSETRKAIEAWAARNRVDLAAAFRAAEEEVPKWGPSDDPKVSPAIAGAEMLVIGQDRTGRLVTVEPGEQVLLVTTSDFADVEARTYRRCRIAGEFRSGLYDYDLRNIYIPLADVQQFMQQPGKVTSISIRLDSFDHAPEVRAALLGILTPDEIAAGIELIRPQLRKSDPEALRDLEKELGQLRDQLPRWFAEGSPMAVMGTVALEGNLRDAIVRVLKMPDGPGADKERVARIRAFGQKSIERRKGGIGSPFRVNTWEDKRRTFLRAVALERHIMAFILLFVGMIAAFLILSILHTTVILKTRDIGILKSIGGSVRGIMSIFLLNGLLMGIMGSALGTAGGMLITRNINAIEAFLHRLLGFSLFPADIYYLDRIPVDQAPWPSVLVICAMAISASLVASLYPAWKASRMDPVEALRHE